MSEYDDIRNVPADELARRQAAAQETIAKAQAKWDRMVRARKPLQSHEGVAELHAGLRDRVATSIFGDNWRTVDRRLMLPCFRDIRPLSDYEAAALITFLDRQGRARAIAAAERAAPLEEGDAE